MNHLLTENEHNQLQSISHNLRFNWRHYFFNPLHSFSEFKEINFTMLSLQWNYFYSGLNKAFQAFQLFFKAALSLLTLNFTEALSQASEMLESGLSSFIKIHLAAFFVGLAILRVGTLLMTTFFQSLSNWMFSDEPLNEDLSREVEIEERKLDLLEDKIRDDIATISQVISDFTEKYTNQNRQIEKYLPTFFEKPSIPHTERTIDPQDQRRAALSLAIDDALSMYPRFDSGLSNDPEYIRWFCQKLEEHHAKTVEIISLYFEEHDSKLKNIFNEFNEIKNKNQPHLG